MCDCSESKTKNNKQYNFKIIAETLYPYPVIFTVKNMISKLEHNLTADEIIRQGNIYDFSPRDIFSIAYCYAEQQFIKY